jgi:hypothetical protein
MNPARRADNELFQNNLAIPQGADQSAVGAINRPLRGGRIFVS